MMIHDSGLLFFGSDNVSAAYVYSCLHNVIIMGLALQYQPDTQYKKENYVP